jgi:SAM-dependent methyltransferase
MNTILQRIRPSLREVVKTHDFRNALEIGFGVGLDVCHFATIYPERKIYGIDISPEMLKHAKTKTMNLKNVCLKAGISEELDALFPDIKFDHIYVFFGALNTVEDLRQTSSLLKNKLNEDGTMVLTFVNKWYILDILIHLIKLNPRKAFLRFRENWGGYSDLKYLESRCFSPGDIRRAFGSDFIIVKKKGYSILYPAWYRNSLLKKLGTRISEILWRMDVILNNTPFWCFGEYALYSFVVKK